ncbi:hypothetical protein [Selenomonas sputigena]|uniref:hypothetical protein n=1 Tax=Selenomonas sputigena TaxID=69823 RepID=UPI0039B6EF36
MSITVAPHAGAWIEMVAEVAARMRTTVAPHAGAWIEILCHDEDISAYFVAPPCGARGLKYANIMSKNPDKVSGLSHMIYVRQPLFSRLFLQPI